MPGRASPSAALPPCPACGAVTGPAEVLCPECDAPLLPAERRVVVLLFVDLSGYTALSQDLDPEVVAGLVQPLMRRLRTAVERRGALVPGIQGDGFMAVFGLPETHEDDARRALEAAAEMQRLAAAWEPGVDVDADLTLHAGVHAGTVLASRSREEGGWTVVGDAVNVASRLCGLADAGQVLASGEVRRLSGVADGWEQERALALRGRRDPVAAAVWRWADAVVEPRRDVRFGARLVDRVDQRAALTAALAAGGAFAVKLEGEPGVGKTRLALEWARSVDAHVLVGRTRAFAAAAWWEPLQDAARTLAGGGGVEALVRLVPDASAVARQRWSALLSGLEADSAEVVDGFDALLSGLSRARPVVLVLDDVQDASAELHAYAAATAAAGLALVLATARPGVTLPGPFSTVVVPPLGPDDGRVLLGQLLDAPGPLLDELHHRIGGNPFYAEECAQLLREAGAAASVQELDRLVAGVVGMHTFVAARIDQLPAIEKTVLQALALLRDGAPLEVLRVVEPAATDAVVARLADRGMVLPATGVCPPFRHGVTREVASAGMSRAAARGRHELARGWYAERVGAGDRALATLAGRASHALAAYDLSVATAQPRGVRAVLAATAADDLLGWAERLRAADPGMSESVAGRVAGLSHAWDTSPTVRLRLRLLEISLALHRGADETLLPVVAEATELARSLDGSWQRRVSLLRSEVLFDVGHRAEARSQLAGLVAAGRAAGDDEVLAEALLSAGDSSDNARDALRCFAEVAEVARDPQLRLRGLSWAAVVAAYFDLGLARDYGIRAAAETSPEDAVDRAFQLLTSGWIGLYDARPSLALAVAREALETGVAGHVWMVEGFASFIAAEASIALGELADAAKLLDSVAGRVRQRPHSKGVITLSMLSARLALREGDLAAARAAADECAAASTDDSFDDGMAPLVTGDLALERGDFSPAADSLRAARAAFAAQGHSVMVAVAGLSLLRAEAAAGLAPDPTLLVAAAEQAGAAHLASLAEAYAAHAAGRPHPFTPADGETEEAAVAADLRALATRDPADLRRAADLWARLGCTVWRARTLLWLGEPDEARDLLRLLGSPPGSEERLLAQWRV